jgi:hypothetical protein
MKEDIEAWFAGRLPEDWLAGPAEVTVDRDEILVVVPVSEPESSEQTKQSAVAGRIARFREDTREHRMRIADEAQCRFGRKVSWGVGCADSRVLFTTVSTPVMTRLRQSERAVLDTLVDSGVARSRSHALAWCVRLVGEHSGEWLGQLREAMQEVERLREAGPSTAAG